MSKWSISGTLGKVWKAAGSALSSIGRALEEASYIEPNIEDNGKLYSLVDGNTVREFVKSKAWSGPLAVGKDFDLSSQTIYPSSQHLVMVHYAYSHPYWSVADKGRAITSDDTNTDVVRDHGIELAKQILSDDSSGQAVPQRLIDAAQNFLSVNDPQYTSVIGAKQKMNP